MADPLLVLLLVALVGIVVLASVCSRLAERVQTEAGRLDLDPDETSPAQRAVHVVRARMRARRGLPLLPHGHRPPAGLAPLSPSERFLRAETARGIRELRLWMLDEDGAAA
ncbi:MAG: hypothetical protein M3P93_02760 [Actinomycetota bacterium]|nr:hypothetical protein [Actinomycetota bacterium]